MKNTGASMATAIMVLTLSTTVYAQTNGQFAQQTTRSSVGLIPSGLYVRGSLGYSWSSEDEIDYSPLWGLGIGYRLTPNIRTDLTIDWRDRYNVEGGQGFSAGGTAIDSKLDNQTYMLNVYYDFDRLPIIELPGSLKPFVGGGIGISRVEVNDRDVLVGGTRVARFTNDNENQFAWQLTLGVGYNVTANVTAEIAYRYADLGEVELTSPVGNVSSDFTVHEAVATLRYQF